MTLSFDAFTRMGQKAQPDQPEAVSVAQALAVERRRDLLDYLHETTTAPTIPELAHDLAAYRRAEPGEPSPLRVATLGSHLRHTDIPLLDQAGLVTHDREHNTVALTPQAKTLTSRSQVESEA